jgi:ACS family hexuronate transporter-like MFS transporter
VSQSVHPPEASPGTSAIPSRRGRFRLRWVILGATAMVLMLNYADRAALSVAGPHIIEELGLTDAQFGLLASAFFFGYVPFAFIGGWLSDRFGPRWIMGVAVAWWSLFTALTAAGVNFVALLVFRVLFGFGEGPQGSVGTKTMNNWFPQRQISTAMGFTQAATPLGGAIGTPLVVGLITVVDWRFAFVVLGVAGLVCTVGWFAVVRDTPELHPWARQQDIDEHHERLAAPVDTEPGAEDDVPPMRHYFKLPIILATSIAFFGYAWVLYTFLTWFPVYLTDARGVDFSGLAVSGTIPWVCGVIGLIAGGIVTDAIVKRNGKPVATRAGVIVVGLLVAAVGFVLAGIVHTTISAVMLMALVVFALYFTCAQYFAIVTDLVPSRRLGGVMGFVHSIANLAGILSPIVVGAIVDRTDNWALTFGISAGICAIGALALAVFSRPRFIGGTPTPAR